MPLGQDYLSRQIFYASKTEKLNLNQDYLSIRSSVHHVPVVSMELACFPEGYAQKGKKTERKAGMNTQGPALLSICAVTLVITCLVVSVLFPWEQTFMTRTSLCSQLCFFSLTQFLVCCKLFTPLKK